MAKTPLMHCKGRGNECIAMGTAAMPQLGGSKKRRIRVPDYHLRNGPRADCVIGEYECMDLNKGAGDCRREGKDKKKNQLNGGFLAEKGGN